MSEIDFSEVEEEVRRYCQGLGITLDFTHSTAESDAMGVQESWRALKHFADRIAERAAFSLDRYEHYYKLGRAFETLTDKLHESKIEIVVREEKK